MKNFGINLNISPVVKATGIFGMNKPLNAHIIYEQSQYKSQLVVVKDMHELDNLVRELQSLKANVITYPIDSYISSDAVAISLEFIAQRQYAIQKLLHSQNIIMVTTLYGFLRKISSKSCYVKKVKKIAVNMEYSFDNITQDLVEMGYKRVSVVSASDEFAIRGHVLDIFVIGSENPVRIEFWGDDVESIRYFDLDSQRTISEISEINIIPCTEIFSNDLTTIAQYHDFQVVAYEYDFLEVEYEQIVEYQKAVEKDGQDIVNLSHDDFDYFLYELHSFSKQSLAKEYRFSIEEVQLFKNDFKILNQLLEEKQAKNYQIYIYAKDSEMRKVIKNKLTIDNYYFVDKGTYSSFIDETHKIVYISYYSLYESISKRAQRNRYKFSRRIKDATSLQVGDYIVHEIHGIGKYIGIKAMEIDGFQQDFFELQYLGSDKLYVPVSQISMITKYSSNSELVPKMNRLGSLEWEKTKRRARERINEMTERLVKLYAEREATVGIKYNGDSVEQQLFEHEFEYELTKDQIRSIKEIKQDMESSVVMDRLLCGDVGFGKTEVAFRAIFKAVDNGYQVAYLCPTTLLSLQHYLNALKRFQNYPINIAILNRFTSAKNRKEIIEKLSTGRIDIIFGTHSLLNKDLNYKSLGLLVIDEEQRFGVEHKERIKEIKMGLDVLTLSATPIPRTLQMSLMGIRSLSLIDTPPANRVPIQTYVVAENNYVIKEAIEKEIARDGQIFILYNRVKSISTVARKIQKLVPKARIAIVHGQMNKEEIEDIMYRFNKYEYDCLITTTIIETGIDIPNANTLIIYNADMFGLSQLYQIRGRVGRSEVVAYAYMMYNDGKKLSKAAVKRLEVIKNFTNLGSGFKIAARDLSIRGAGDILGVEQSGAIDTIGVEMYTKMLKEAIGKGEDLKEEKKIALKKEAHIADDYVKDDDIKLKIHQLINSVRNYDDKKRISDELSDLYGKIPEEIEKYLENVFFENYLTEFGFAKLRHEKNLVKAKLLKDDIDGVCILQAASKTSREIKLLNTHDGVELVINKQKVLDYQKLLLNFIDNYNRYITK